LTHDLTVLLVGLDDATHEELAGEEGFAVESAPALDEGLVRVPAPDAVVVALDGLAPIETIGRIHAHAPDAAVVVVTDPSNEADGAVARHAGAEDHLVRGAMPQGLLVRAVRYAIEHRRMQRDLATTDPVTGMPNIRGFGAIAEHHLRMADRAKHPVVFLFVRLDGFAQTMSNEGATGANEMARNASEVLMQAVRDSDVPARVAPDTFCVLLTGEATGAETLVLSRLVEAIAVHNARSDQPRSLSLSVGSSLYDPEHPASLEQILESAGRHLAEQSAQHRSDTP
jgi:diguanylate cyclase (GGDEF)-like protein